METETALSILYAITAAGALIWFASLQFLLVSFRKPKPAMDGPAQEIRFGQQPPSAPPGLIVGHAEVEGQPAELAAKAASLLAGEPQGSFELLRILERTEDRVSFEGTGYTAPGSSRPGHIAMGQLRFAPLGNGRTAVDYAISVSGGRFLWLAVIFQALGLLGLVAGFWLIHSFVVPHGNPAIRGQVVQMVQIIHFLWPPFLFAGLYRAGRRVVRTRFEALVHNLPYYGGELVVSK